VERIHSDRGSEFLTKKMKAWTLAQGIRHTTTTADDPAANGRAEEAVGFYKRKGRTVLRGSGLSTKFWPYAIQYVNEAVWKEFHREPAMPLAFGARILVRNKQWQLLDAFENRAVPGRYLMVGWDLSRTAAYVLMDDGIPDGTVTRATTFWPDPEANVPEPTPADLLAAGWEVRRDPEDLVCYYHRFTKEVRREQPLVVYEERDPGDIPGPRRRITVKTPAHMVPRRQPQDEAVAPPVEVEQPPPQPAPAAETRQERIEREMQEYLAAQDAKAEEEERRLASSDSWEVATRTWIRHHKTPRTTKYDPQASPNGPSFEELSKDRCTVMTFEDGTSRSDMDDWTGPKANHDMKKSWTGKTVFMKKEPILGRGPRRRNYSRNPRPECGCHRSAPGSNSPARACN
jgi:hypothetical protein